MVIANVKNSIVIACHSIVVDRCFKRFFFGSSLVGYVGIICNKDQRD